MSSQKITDRMLRAMSADHGAEPPEKWQQRKSQQTRDALINAGIDCLVDAGYTGLTTSAVAERCGMSRGAMHHHFATRMALVTAVIEEVFYSRMRNFLRDYFAQVDRHEAIELIRIATQVHWQSVQSREYAAYRELTAAAKTDEELAALFVPSARRYDTVWRTEMIEAFPLWENHWDGFKLANDFVTVAHMGLQAQQDIWSSEERTQLMLDQIERVAQRIFEDVRAKDSE